jgi:hypothetical protein
MRSLMFLTLLLPLSSCTAPSPRPERTLELTRYQALDFDISPLAPVFDRYAVRVPSGQGLKVWLEVKGERVAQLGFRHKWEKAPLPMDQQVIFEHMDEGQWLRFSESERRHDTVWIHFRDLPLRGLASPHRNVELMLASGWLEDGYPHFLRDARAQGTSYAIPGDPSARRKLLQPVPLNQTEHHDLVELKAGSYWSTPLRIAPNTPLAVATFPSPHDVRLWVELVTTAF